MKVSSLGGKRVHERNLIAIAAVILLTGFSAVWASTGKFDSYLLLSLGLMILVWFTAHYLIRRFSSGDAFIFPLALTLSAIGLIAICRLKPALLGNQLLWNALGIAAYICSAYFFRRLDSFADYKYLIGILGVGLLLSAILFGVEIGGNKNWVVLGAVRFQPSEFAKLLIVIFLAAYLADRREIFAYSTRRLGPFKLPPLRVAAPLLTLWGITMMMLIVQRDLGSALLYFATALGMMYVASSRLSYVIMGLILFFIGSLLCYYFFPHVQIRIDIWLNPWSDPTGRAYQVIQSLFALGSGGMIGSGLGYGFPGLIPEVHTDFIFAAIGEELGFVASGAVLMVYMMLLSRFFRAALQAETFFRKLTLSGLAIFIGLQVLIIIGGVTKFLPLTGVTLPFVSYGGSSLVSSYILLGIFSANSDSGESYG